MPVECPVCEGTGFVVWENSVPRALKPDEKAEGDCPACDGRGHEPAGGDEYYRWIHDLEERT